MAMDQSKVIPLISNFEDMAVVALRSGATVAELRDAVARAERELIEERRSKPVERRKGADRRAVSRGDDRRGFPAEISDEEIREEYDAAYLERLG